MQTPPALSSTARQYGHLALAFAELATIVSARSRMALEQKSGFVPAMVVADPVSRRLGECAHDNRDREGPSRHRRRRRRCGRAGAGARHSSATMIPIPSGVRVWIATGYTDMR